MSKWINTKSVFKWDKKSKEYKEISNEGYEYEGDLALAMKTPSEKAMDKTKAKALRDFHFDKAGWAKGGEVDDTVKLEPKQKALIKEAFGAGGGIVEESRGLADNPFKITEYAEGGVVGGYAPGDARTLKDS